MKSRLIFLSLFALISLVVMPRFIGIWGCGGVAETSSEEGTTTTDAAKPTVSVTGTVTVPASSSSALVAGLVMKDATTDGAGSGMTCEGFTLEGEDLGDATTDTSGNYTLAAVIESLKPTDATTTSWKARFYIKCTDSSGKYDIRNYCEATVEEGTTSSITCHATPETTLTTLDLLTKSGCVMGASCAMEGIDPLCFVA
ncbi:MAG: hypothetical protein HYT76_04125, partial [Deltaproteobacteria bacterium]|nr:hypothetical protein [Deltaproteobacteria bacterium]